MRDDLFAFLKRKFGFILDRCTYNGDDKWSRFMSYLNIHTRACLEQASVGELFEKLDWSVQESPELDGASDAAVRKWVEICKRQQRGPFKLPRTKGFLTLDQLGGRSVRRYSAISCVC
jgi:hypothetical protein